MSQGVTIDIKTRLVGYEASLRQMEQAFAKVDPGSSIGRELKKAIESANAQLKALGKNLSPRVTSDNQIDAIVGKVNNLGETIQHVTALMKNVDTSDLNLGALGQEVEILKRQIDDLQNKLNLSKDNGLKQALKDSSELKAVFESLGTNIDDIGSEKGLKILENGLKTARDEAQKTSDALKNVTNKLKEQEDSYLKKYSDNAFSNGKFDVDNFTNRIKQIKTPDKIIDQDKIKIMQDQMINSISNLKLGSAEQESLALDFIDQLFKDITPDNIKGKLDTFFDNFKEQLNISKDKLRAQLSIGSNDKFANNLLGIDEAAVIEAKNKLSNMLQEIASGLNSKEIANIKTKIDTVSIEKSADYIIGVMHEANQRVIDAEKADLEEISKLEAEQILAKGKNDEANKQVNIMEIASRQYSNLIETLTTKVENQQKEIDILNQKLATLLVEKTEQLKIESNESNITAQSYQISTTEILKYKQALEQVHQREQLVGRVQGVVQRWFSIYAAVRMVNKAIRSVISTIQELDKTITEIAIVTSMNQSDLWGQMSSYTDMARQYAASISGVYKVSQLYYQQGLQTAEVMALTEQTLKMARISGLDYAEATNFMTNAIRSFKMEMTDAQRVVDVYSAVAAASATDTTELAKAMSKTASSAEAVGSSFENTTAMMAVMIEATRESAENIGSALKSIISRYGEMKVNPAALVDSEGEEMSLNKVDTALQSVGISIHDAAGQFRDFDDVIMELAKSWDTIDKNTQRYIATVMAGNRQQSRFLALVSSYDRLKELSATAADSEDASQLQFLKTLDSVDAKIQQFKTSLQSLYVESGLEKFYKGLIDFSNNLLKSFTSMPKLMNLPILALTKLGSSFMTLALLAKNALTFLKTSIVMEGKSIEAIIKLSEGNRLSTEETYAALRIINARKEAEEKLEIQKEYNKQVETLTEEETAKLLALQQNSSNILKTQRKGMILSAIGLATSLGASRISTNTAVGRASAGALNIGGSILSGFGTGMMMPGTLSMKVIMGVMAALPGVIQGFTQWFESAEERAQRLKEAAEEASNTLIKKRNEVKTLDTQIDQLVKLKASSKDSTEALQEYYNAVNAFANDYPDLVEYYDNEGNAVINLEDAYLRLAEARIEANEAARDSMNASSLEAENAYKESQNVNESRLIEQIRSATNNIYNTSLKGDVEKSYQFDKVLGRNNSLQALISNLQLGGLSIYQNERDAWEKELNDLRNSSNESDKSVADTIDELLILIDDILENNALYDNKGLANLNKNYRSNLNNYLRGQNEAWQYDAKTGKKLDNTIFDTLDFASEIIQEAMWNQFNSVKDNYTSTSTSSKIDQWLKEEGTDYYNSVYTSLKDFWEPLEDSQDDLLQLMKIAGNYTKENFFDAAEELIGDEIPEQIKTYFTNILFPKDAYSAEDLMESILGKGFDIDFSFDKQLGTNELKAISTFANDVSKQYKDDIENKGNGILQRYINLWEILLDSDETTQSILSNWSDWSLTGIYTLYDKLTDSLKETDHENLIEEIKKQLIGENSLVEIIDKNLVIEYENFAQKIIGQTEDFDKALQKAQKGLDLSDAIEMSTKLGIKLDDFDFQQGKYFFNDPEAIKKVYLQQNEAFREKLNQFYDEQISRDDITQEQKTALEAARSQVDSILGTYTEYQMQSFLIANEQFSELIKLLFKDDNMGFAEGAKRILSENTSGLGDQLQTSLKTFAELVINGITGSLTREEAKKIKINASEMFGIDLKTTQSQDGLGISLEAATNLYFQLKQIDNISASLVFDALRESLEASGEDCENISTTMASIKRLEDKLVNDKNNQKLKERLSLYQQIAAQQMRSPEQYDFMGRDLPDYLQGPQNYWDSVDKFIATMNESAESGYMDISDFYNIVNEMSNLAELGGDIELFGVTLDGNLETASKLIQQGLNAITLIEGKGAKIDLSKFGIDFSDGVDSMAKNVEQGIHAMAEANIQMLDGMIQMLETVVAMENLDKAAGLTGENNILDFEDLFQIDSDGLARVTEEFRDGAAQILKLAKENEDLNSFLNTTSFNGDTLYNWLKTASEDGTLNQEEAQELTLVLQGLYSMLQSGEYDLQNIQESLTHIMEQAGFEGTITLGNINFAFGYGTSVRQNEDGSWYTLQSGETISDYLEALKAKTLDELAGVTAINENGKIVGVYKIAEIEVQVDFNENGEPVYYYGDKSFTSKEQLLTALYNANKEDENKTQEILTQAKEENIRITSSYNGIEYIIQLDENGKPEYVTPDGSHFSTEQSAINHLIENYQPQLNNEESKQILPDSIEVQVDGRLSVLYKILELLNNPNPEIDDSKLNLPDGITKETLTAFIKQIIAKWETGEDSDSEKVDFETILEDFNTSEFPDELTAWIKQVVAQWENPNSADRYDASGLLDENNQFDLGTFQATAKIDSINFSSSNYKELRDKLSNENNNIVENGLFSTDVSDYLSTLQERIEKGYVLNSIDNKILQRIIREKPENKSKFDTNDLIDKTINKIIDKNSANLIDLQDLSNIFSTAFSDIDVVNVQDCATAMTELLSSASKVIDLEWDKLVKGINSITAPAQDSLIATDTAIMREIVAKVKIIYQDRFAQEIITQQAINRTVNLIANATSIRNALSNLSATVGVEFAPPGASEVRGSGGNARAAGQTRKTLMGELGPELVVSNGRYFVVGQNGAEFVNLASDAIVFNHLQTKKILAGGVSSRGRAITGEKNAISMAGGNVSGPAMASAAAALSTLKKIRAMWQSMLDADFSSLAQQAGSGGGGGGGKSKNTIDPGFIADLELWYNLLRQIAKLERDISYEEKLRSKQQGDLVKNGQAYYESQKRSLEALDQQIAKNQDLSALQKSYYDKRREDLANSKFGQIFTFNEDGLMQYNDTATLKNGDKGGLFALAKINAQNPDNSPVYTAKQQYELLKSWGFSDEELKYDASGNLIQWKDDDGKLRQEAYTESVEAFWDKIDAWKDELDSLYDSYNDTLNDVLDEEVARNEILKEIQENQLSLEEKILKSIENREQKVIDKLDEEKNALEDATDAYLDGLNRQLENEREIYQKQQESEDLNKLRRQLAILQRSGGSASQIRSIQNQISSKEQDTYFDLQQEQIDAIKDASDKQIEQLEAQLDVMKESLEYQKEHGLLWAEVSEIMAQTPEDIMAFLTTWNPELEGLSALGQETTMQEIKSIIDQWVARRDDEKDPLEADRQSEAGQGWQRYATQIKPEFSKVWTDANVAKAEQAYLSSYAIDSDPNKAAAAARAVFAEQMAEYYRLHPNEDPKNNLVKLNGASSSSNASGSSGSGNSSGSSKTNNSAVQAATRIVISTSNWQYNNTYHWKVRKYSDGKEEQVQKAIHTYTTVTENNVRKKKCKVCGYSLGATLPTTGGGGGGNVMLKYASGGLVNYTGLAMVHGTKTKPEAFLSAQETQLWKNDILSGKNGSLTSSLLNLNNAIQSLVSDNQIVNNNSTSRNNAITIEHAEVNMNTTIANDYDARRAGQNALEEMVKIARKSGAQSVGR